MGTKEMWEIIDKIQLRKVTELVAEKIERRKFEDHQDQRDRILRLLTYQSKREEDANDNWEL